MHIFRYLTGFGLTAAVFAIAITPAHACQGPQFEFHILSSHIPADTKNADFVGKVEIKLKRRWLLRLPGETYGYLANVLESSTHSDLVGGKIDLPPIILLKLPYYRIIFHIFPLTIPARKKGSYSICTFSDILPVLG